MTELLCGEVLLALLEFYQVYGTEVAGGIVHIKILLARVGRSYHLGVRAGVPRVSVVEIVQTRVSYHPRRPGYLGEERPGADGLAHLPCRPERQVVVLVLRHPVHERRVSAYVVVRVLARDGLCRLPVEIRVELGQIKRELLLRHVYGLLDLVRLHVVHYSLYDLVFGVAARHDGVVYPLETPLYVLAAGYHPSDLLLLFHLPVYEVLYLRVIDVYDPVSGAPPGPASALHRVGVPIEYFEEGHHS